MNIWANIMNLKDVIRVYNTQDLYMYEILADYKNANSIEEKNEIFNEFCNLIWSSNNDRRVYKKDITFKINDSVLPDTIGQILKKWTSITYMGYKRSSKETDFVSLIRQKINNIYTNMFDTRVVLNKEYMDLVKTPKNLYYQWKNGRAFTESELTEIIDNAISGSIKIKEKYVKQKMKLKWKNYKMEVEKCFRKCFDNYKSLDDYENGNYITLYVDTWCEDNFYIKYFCKSLNGYFKDYQKEYYDVKKRDKKSRCLKCGSLFKQEYCNQKLCNECSKYHPIETKTIICQDCGKEVSVDSLNTKTIRCDECQRIFRNNYQKELMRKKRSC